MIRPVGPVVLAAVFLAGCTGAADSAADPAASTSGGASVTVTATVTAPPASSPRSPSSSGSGPAPALPARCDAPALTVGIGESQGAAGTTFRTIVFRNGGEQPCYLRGFPGVSAADAAGKAKVDATRDTSKAVANVVLAPGHAAHAVLAVSSVSAGAKPCPTYPTLLVTPPDSRRTQTLTVDVTPCGGRMRITAVQPGEG